MQPRRETLPAVTTPGPTSKRVTELLLQWDIDNPIPTVPPWVPQLGYDRPTARALLDATEAHERRRRRYIEKLQKAAANG